MTSPDGLPLFTVEDRERARERVLELAASDERVVAGAVVGSLALGDGDRFSDLDLTFAVADGVPVPEVLEDWTRTVVDELDGVHLFDLPSGASIYRVFLLPGCLQFDLSFTPAAAFGAGGPKFRLLFGDAVERPYAEPPSAHELFGHARAPRAARPLLHRARALLAGRVLDQRGAPLRALARLPSPRPARHAREGVRRPSRRRAR